MKPVHQMRRRLGRYLLPLAVLFSLLHPNTGAAMITTDKVFADPRVAQLANAAQDGDLARIEKLIKAGAPVKFVGQEGMTVTHYALRARRNAPQVMELLLKAGADPVERDAAGGAVLEQLPGRRTLAQDDGSLIGGVNFDGSRGRDHLGDGLDAQGTGHREYAGADGGVIGVVIRGGTPHFEYVCKAATDGLGQVALGLGASADAPAFEQDDVHRAGRHSPFSRRGAVVGRLVEARNGYACRIAGSDCVEDARQQGHVVRTGHPAGRK